jgi:hypothetical protein
MTHRQFHNFCKRRLLEPELYEGVQYPHPYLMIWLECRKQANPITGAISYPDPTKGYLEQDAELMLALEVLEELYQELEQEKDRLEKVKEYTQKHFG